MLDGSKEQQIQSRDCGPTQLSADKKGFDLAKAAVGGAITGGVGLLVGFIGSRNVRVTCLVCVHAWNIQPAKKQQGFKTWAEIRIAGLSGMGKLSSKNSD